MNEAPDTKRVRARWRFSVAAGAAALLILAGAAVVSCGHSSTSTDVEGAAVYPKAHRSGLRPGAPYYAKHGPHWVGHRTFDAPGPGRTMPVDVWYPARNPADAAETITYRIRVKNPVFAGALATKPSRDALVVTGNAIANAPAEATSGPHPVVVFSHAYSLSGAWHAPLVEHYASQGFVVLAPEHDESDWSDAWKAAVDRPRDIAQTLDFGLFGGSCGSLTWR